MPEPKFESVADVVAREFKCDHDETQLVQRKLFSLTFIRQCLRCGGRVAGPLEAGEIDPQEMQVRGVHEWEEALRNDWEARKAARIDELQLERKQNWGKWYEGYLKSEQWQEIRKRMFDRANRLCEGCLREWATEVHHMTYNHAGNEFMWELKAVCVPCHKRWHEIEE